LALEFVIVGGGDFAVEVAAYLMDIWNEEPAHRGVVSDIVAQGNIRRDDLEKVLGSAPAIKERPAEVERLEEKRVVIAVGDPSLRYRFMQELDKLGARFGTIVHPTAYVASTAVIEDGAVLCPMTFVGPFAHLSRNCVLNVHAVAGHDVTIGECAVLSPGADVNGHGLVGEGALLGAGAIISPKAGLGAFGKLSAGSVLTRQAGEGFLMHGNPATGRQMFRRP
jgi:sugar O-acyltransferase (sialic acid O-acetyltransferase NeuD family)